MGVVSVIEAEKPSVALTLPKSLPFEEWVTLGRRLCASSQVINWHIGDWWAFGEQRYGQRAKAAAEGVFGLSFQGLVDCATVARSFESTRRRVDLSFSHHREVAALPAPEADALLARAEAELLSTRELRQEVRVIRGSARQRDVIDVRREPACAEFMTSDEIIIELATALSRERALSDRESGFLQRSLGRMHREDERLTDPWTSEDDIELIGMVNDGKRPAEIAPILNRTEPAVRKRLGILRAEGKVGYYSPEGGTGRYPRNGSKAGEGAEGVEG